MKNDPKQQSLQVGIVNDSVIATETLRRIIISNKSYHVTWTAKNGAEAIMHCNNIKPDVILMDIMMPVMDGIEATRRIMETNPCAILVVTSSVTGNASEVFKAMGAGALDAVATPVVGTSIKDNSGKELLRKIELIRKLIDKKTTSPQKTSVNFAKSTSKDNLVAIGCSTGGPQAISEILATLPANINAAIVVIQHMDKKFTPGLVSWLNKHNSIHMPIKLIEEGERLKKGTVYIPLTDHHLVLKKQCVLQYTKSSQENFYHPSVDVFFESAAKEWNGNLIGILLTGMGRDGAMGLLSIKEKGSPTIAQDQNTSIVYGMPKAAADLNAAKDILPLHEIGNKIIELISKN